VIVGLGVELVDTERFAAAERRFGARLRARLFTEAERAFAARRPGVQSLAARFAAKLAARRALGAGLRWHEVEVVRERDHAPALRFHGAAAEAARRAGVTHVSVTLTHDRAACLSQVVLERRP
jgi:holo-[acyl-carrier protein] synthase